MTPDALFPVSQPDGLAIFSCEFCERSHRADGDFFSWRFSDRIKSEAAADAIVEALGFCASHARALSASPRLSRGVATAFRDASRTLHELLKNPSESRERLQRVLFGAPGACPACAHRDQSVERLAKRFAGAFAGNAEQKGSYQALPMCFPHFRVVALIADPERIEDLLRLFTDEFRRVRSRLAKSLAGSAGTASAGRHSPAQIESMLRAVAGSPPALHADAFPDPNRLAERIEENLSNREWCPVCIEVRRAQERWHRQLETAAEFQEDVWLLYPSCPAHIWAATQRHGPRVALTAGRQACENALTVLHRTAEALARARALEMELDARSERRRPAISDAAFAIRGAIRSLRPCPACRRLQVARDRAIQRILDLLHEPRHRAALERGHGMCAKHFASAYFLAGKGNARQALAEALTARIADLLPALDAEAGAPKDSGGSRPMRAWREALLRISGFA